MTDRPSPAAGASVDTDSVGANGAGSESTRRPVLQLIRLVANVVFVYVLIVEVLLLIGFVCLVLGVEPASWLVDVVYRSVERAMQPFRGMFGAIRFGTGTTEEVESVVESSILFAMIVYGIIGLAARDLAEWIGPPRRD